MDNLGKFIIYYIIILYIQYINWKWKIVVPCTYTHRQISAKKTDKSFVRCSEVNLNINLVLHWDASALGPYMKLAFGFM